MIHILLSDTNIFCANEEFVYIKVIKKSQIFVCKKSKICMENKCNESNVIIKTKYFNILYQVFASVLLALYGSIPFIIYNGQELNFNDKSVFLIEKTFIDNYASITNCSLDVIPKIVLNPEQVLEDNKNIDLAFCEFKAFYLKNKTNLSNLNDFKNKLESFESFTKIKKKSNENKILIFF